VVKWHDQWAAESPGERRRASAAQLAEQSEPAPAAQQSHAEWVAITHTRLRTRVDRRILRVAKPGYQECIAPNGNAARAAPLNARRD